MTFKTTILFLLFSCNAFCQSQEEHKLLYHKAYEEQLAMLQGRKYAEFKRAVFLVENAYLNNTLNYQLYNLDISLMGETLKRMIQEKGIERYKTAGNWAIFTYMTDTIQANSFKPFTYDFDDFYGKTDRTKSFVTKLLRTKSGNCQSLPYLYKILADEIGAKASLVAAPNHLYVKHIDEKGQWVNVELTNPSFPRDQWLIKSMAIPVETIRNGSYMMNLKPKEEIAHTMADLAIAYQFQFGHDNFVVEMCNSAIKYYPKSIELQMIKGNAYYGMFLKEKEKGFPNHVLAQKLMNQHKAVIAQIDQMGYKDMPKELYDEWVRSVEAEKSKRQAQAKLETK